MSYESKSQGYLGTVKNSKSKVGYMNKTCTKLEDIGAPYALIWLASTSNLDHYTFLCIFEVVITLYTRKHVFTHSRPISLHVGHELLRFNGISRSTSEGGSTWD